MPELVHFIIPAELNAAGSTLLIVISFFTSAMTAAFGLGGGSALIAVMSLMMPPAIVVPVHGAVQLGSNAGRAWIRRPHIQWHFVGWFIFGSVIGALAGSQIVSILPENLFRAAIAVFILITIWLPLPKVGVRTGWTTSLAGALTSAVGMVVGVAGPLVIAFLRNLKDRREIVATHAFLMTMQNILKLLAFMMLGFAFHTYLGLILCMVASGFLGTRLGSALLDRIPENVFRWTFRIILTFIAIDLLRRAIAG